MHSETPSGASPRTHTDDLWQRRTLFTMVSTVGTSEAAISGIKLSFAPGYLEVIIYI